MKIEVVRAFCIHGEPVEVGSVHDLPDGVAKELIGMRKAIGHVEKAEPEAKPARARRAKAEAATDDGIRDE